MKNWQSIGFGFLGAFIFHFLNIQFFTPALAKDANVIKATSFNLEDANGKLRGQFGISKEGTPAFWMFDEKGVARLAMGLYPDGTGHYGLQDKNGLMIQLARSFGVEESPLLIFKHRGNDSMIMGLNPTDQTPFVMYYDRARSRKLNFGKYEGP